MNNSVAEDRTNCDNVIKKDLATQSKSADVDILPAPERLRDLARERELRYEGEEVYRALEQSGELENVLDREVKRMQDALQKLTEELKAKGYSDRDACDRAWGSVERNWPFGLDDGEVEEKNHKKKQSYRPTWVVVTSKNGARFYLKQPRRTNKKFKALVKAIEDGP